MAFMSCSSRSRRPMRPMAPTVPGGGCAIVAIRLRSGKTRSYRPAHVRVSFGFGDHAMHFRILGPLEVRDGERVLDVGGGKQRAVLALLLLHANEVVGSDRLIDELWPDEPPRSAAKIVQVHVSRLRKVLDNAGEGILVTRDHGYLLRVEPGRLDVERFQELLGEG